MNRPACGTHTQSDQRPSDRSLAAHAGLPALRALAVNAGGGLGGTSAPPPLLPPPVAFPFLSPRLTKHTLPGGPTARVGVISPHVCVALRGQAASLSCISHSPHRPQWIGTSTSECRRTCAQQWYVPGFSHGALLPTLSTEDGKSFTIVHF